MNFSAMELMMSYVITAVCAYLLGSIPFGYLIVRLRSGGDVRETGSGGTGATNVSRRAGKLAGLLTLLLDAAKGTAAIALARWMTGLPLFEIAWSVSPQVDNWMVCVATVAVLLGHLFPVWLRFKGGKGVATTIGVFLLLAPFPLLVCGIVFIAVVATTRYVSLGSLGAAILLPILLVFSSNGNSRPIVVAASLATLFIVFAHRANVSRLLAGTENKFR